MSLTRPRLFLACLLWLFPAWLHGGYTARKAQELLLQSVPREVSNQIVAITGFAGATEPETWLFLVRPPSPPGAMIEYQVQDGAVRGPRTLAPEEIPAGLDRPLPPGLLPVDSHDVARIIDDAIILEGLQFARLDYQLCFRDKGPEPLWLATLVGARGETLGHVFVSATSGAVTHRAFYHQFPRLPLPSAPGNAPAAQTGKPGRGAPGADSASPPAPEVRPAPSGASRAGATLFRKRSATPAFRPPPRMPAAGEAPAEPERSSRQIPPFLRRR